MNRVSFLVSTATPKGKKRLSPDMFTGVVVPVIIPVSGSVVRLTLRILLLKVSATNRLSELSTVIP